jgi:quercetin 2,3-dioxygenase
VHLARGEATANGVELSAGDGVSLEDESEVRLSGVRDAELLVFDLA